MRRPNLSTLLLALNALLVTVAVVCVAAVASGLLGRLAAEQGVARVRLAGAGALQAVERSGEEVHTSAVLLSERPTVVRLAQAGDDAALAAFLERFRRTSRLTGCAVVMGSPLPAMPVIPSGSEGSGGRAASLQPSGELTALAAAGPSLPWARLLGSGRAAEGSEGGISLVRVPGGPPLLVAAAPILELPGARAAAVLALGDDFFRAASARVGLPVVLRTAEEARALSGDPGEPLRERALGSGRTAAGRLPRGGPFVSVSPLLLGGRPAALLETTLPAAAVAHSVARFERALLLVALATAGLATLAGLLVGRRLARPVRLLTAAAARIGRGDLATPLATLEAAPGAEIGTLAATMEEMRRRLLALTAELRRRQAEAEAVLTGIAEGVFAVDADRRIRYLNPQGAAMLGIAPGSLDSALGRFCGDLLNPQGPGGVRPCEESCPIVHARFRGGARAVEHLLTAAGERRTVVVTSSPPAEGRQFQVLRDETETEAVRRLRDTVLAHISHEFKTPLAAQLASLELLRDRLPAAADGDGGELVASLERGTLRLTQLVDNLLESVRIEAGQHGIRRRPVALDEVVEAAVEMTAPLLGQRGQRVEVELPYPLPPVSGDGPRLTQVFVNLLANANKFAPAGSAIRVGGAVAEGAVALWVEDAGPGLPEEGGEALFERFVRTPVEDGEGVLATEPEQSGMGLGLWIVKSIVERHGGRVEALPAPGGEGARVRVTLPRQQAEAAA